MTTDATEKKFAAYAPNGAEIRGQMQVIREVVALIDHFTAPDGDGDDAIEFAGETDVDWDTQEPSTDEDGEYLYVDIHGNIWPASRLTFKELA